MTKKSQGRLIIIGGHEAKTPEQPRPILKEVVKRVAGRKGKLLVVTVASNEPEDMAAGYRHTFGELGLTELEVMDIRNREEAYSDENIQKLPGINTVFFTGGDQLRITSQLGDTPVYQHMLKILESGGTVVGTSAGAAAMSQTMLIAGPGDESNKISALNMAPGLGLIKDVVIDSHFAERGRVGRLLGAIAQNPKNIGLGIDEDTAVIVEADQRLRVIGTGAVYVIDGAHVTYSSLAEQAAEGIVSIHNLRLHVLGTGNCYDLTTRQPVLEE